MRNFFSDKKINIFLPNPVPFVKTEKGVEVYKNLKIGNFGTQFWDTSIVQPCKPSWKAGKPSLQTLFSDKKGRIRQEKAKVCTPPTFSDSEGTYDDDDDDDEMMEKSVLMMMQTNTLHFFTKSREV